MTDPNHNSENSGNPSQGCPESPADPTSSSEEMDLVIDSRDPDDLPPGVLEIEVGSQPEHSAKSSFGQGATEEARLAVQESTLLFNGSESFAIRRIPRNEPSFFKKVVPPILGGLAAFPIATAIMWYGLGRDIGTTGPFVAKYAPWIVPTKLQGGSFRSDGTFGGSFAKKKPKETIPSQTEPLSKSAPSDTSKSEKKAPSINVSSESEAPIVDLAVPKTERPPALKKEQDVGPSVRKTLLQIAALQKDWNNTPKDREKQLKKLSEFYSACLQLSSQTGALRGNAIRAWQEDLDQFAKSILASTTFSRAIELCSQGSIQGIPSPAHGDNVVLIETLSINKDLAGDQKFPSTLIRDNQPLPLVFPESIIKRLQNSPEPRKRILLGRIIDAIDAESSSIIRIHCCLE
jgi:hypothetical protein